MWIYAIFLHKSINQQSAPSISRLSAKTPKSPSNGSIFGIKTFFSKGSEKGLWKIHLPASYCHTQTQPDDFGTKQSFRRVFHDKRLPAYLVCSLITSSIDAKGTLLNKSSSSFSTSRAIAILVKDCRDISPLCSNRFK